MQKNYRQAGITALIFDFDGTLALQTLDFAVMRREAVAAAALHANVPHKPELPTVELLHLLAADESQPELARKTAINAALSAIKRVEIEAAQKSTLFPYVRPLLARIKELNLLMGIVTRNCPEAVRTVFPDAEFHCRVLTRDDVPKVKPDPGHLEKALGLLGVSPQNALMIGDHPMDIEVGKRVGSLTAGVATGTHSLESLAACAPDYVAKNGAELLRRLDIL